MKHNFTADFFQGNRERLKNIFTGTAPIVITANGLLQRSADETYRFRQDSNFWYLTGIDEPNFILVMDKGNEYLIAPELSHARIMFDGTTEYAELARISGITQIMSEKEGWKKLSSRLKRSTSAAVLSPSPSYIDYLGMYTSPARRRLIKELKNHNKDLVLLDLRQHLQRMRMVKQPIEIQAITTAIDITVNALQKVEQKFRQEKYKNEYEVELDLTKYFRGSGAVGHGFDPIVAAGKQAATIHYMSNDTVIESKQPLLLDVGAQYGHYTADLSCCWVSQPTRRYEAVYAAVKEVADYAMTLLKPGVVVPEYEKQVENFMGEKLRSLGLIKTIESEAIRRYFPHRTSHFLGIDVHDVGDYDHPLEPGVVLTVEPGIYIPEEGIGVRIEDDVIVTTSGIENLSKKLSRKL